MQFAFEGRPVSARIGNFLIQPYRDDTASPSLTNHNGQCSNVHPYVTEDEKLVMVHMHDEYDGLSALDGKRGKH